MGVGEDIKKHLEEHEVLGMKRFRIGNDTDYLEFDPTNHTATLVLNGVTIWSEP